MERTLWYLPNMFTPMEDNAHRGKVTTTKKWIAIQHMPWNMMLWFNSCLGGIWCIVKWSMGPFLQCECVRRWTHHSTCWLWWSPPYVVFSGQLWNCASVEAFNRFQCTHDNVKDKKLRKDLFDPFWYFVAKIGHYASDRTVDEQEAYSSDMYGNN